MTGRYHYQAAERLITSSGKDDIGHDQKMRLLAEAQVRATLALAAAAAPLYAEDESG